MRSPSETLHGLLEDAAVHAADRVAIRCDGEQITFGELGASVDALAARLRAGGVQPGDRVGVHLAKTIEAVTSVYAVMKAGAAYVPLDRRAPIGRLAGIAANTAISALVTQGDAGRALTAAMAMSPSLVVDVDDGWGNQGTEGTAPPPAVASDDVAYILATSGSTGVPKGVVLTHGNALAFVRWAVDRIGVRPDDRLSSHAPLHFDLSIFDLYAAAMVGATLVIVPDAMASMGTDLVDLVAREQITMWYSVPSALMLMTRAASGPEPLASLRTVLFAGEVFPVPRLRELRSLVPDAALWNLYGPTETNVCTYLEVRDIPDDDDASLPIGYACENGTEVFAVTPAGDVAGVGTDGELFVTGPTVMRGYWGMPERDAEVLVADPRGGQARCYRTGDIVRLRDDGAYDFRGRRDHQIKSRGYRIELGEIEVALQAHPDVAEGFAVAIPHEEWGTAVIGCVVLREGASVVESDLRRYVSKVVPRYMVPVRVDVLEATPRTSNGKVDRARLLDDAAAIPVAGTRARTRKA